ncbi:uncharacterized protein LOC124914911 [Impatiens glandulifera]|uniref:uncharacterized protein LOC124914911 n=1 Tax=Impatiens glandulifera TaxID=253017 RepID=UPI001FB0F13E|nr:uncharacterized protein LOC124914911 [Impatiens glandulifera]
MGKGEKVGRKRNVKRGIDCKYTGSDDSDEDYTVGEDEECNESDECSSFAGEESDESLFEFEGEIEDEKKRKVNRSKGRCFSVRNVPKKRRSSYREEDDGDFNDDDDFKDEEFTPDENDLDDEEEDDDEEIAKTSSRKKGSVKKLKGKKKGKSNISKKRRVTNNNGKNLPRKKKRSRTTEDSDLDIMSSKSSDYEYTVSEEEREQLMEASDFCRNLSHNLRNSSSNSNVHHKRGQPPKKKQKTKVDDVLKKEEGKQACGICFSEEGNKRKIRGTLNCCSHYFCFTCIFEWSKVESRCPMCKQRFNNISKPSSKSNAVVIQVPERDQIYQPSEEEILSYLDPYENMICIECHQAGDDALMLLCDLCDSPSHTFCVGLGREVPEGNWYCEGCRPTVVGPGSSIPQTQNHSNEIDLNEAYVPETPLSRVNSYVSSQVNRTRPFTVSERRRLQHRINILVNNRVTAFVNRNRFEDSIPQNDRSREVAFQPTGGRSVALGFQVRNWDLFSLSSQTGQTSTSADISGGPTAGSDAGISMFGQREDVIGPRGSQRDPRTLF